MMVTLYSGHIQGGQTHEGTAPAVLDRDVMLVYEGTFQSMDGEVTITRAHLEKLAKNHNARLDTLTFDHKETPMRDLPPIQLDHTGSARDTVGRVVSKLELKDVTIEGKQCVALFGRARFLGIENCERASDGRWTNVSIGADLEAGVLKELSVTPFPAAQHAALLAKGATMPMPEEMKKRCKKYLTEEKKLSDKEADEKLAALSDDDAKKLSEEVDEDDKKKLAAEEDEEKKKLAAEEDEKKKDLGKEPDGDEGAKLAAKRAKVTNLMAEAKATAKLAKLEAKRSEVSVRLSGLRAKQLITPAEEKTLSDLRLAEASDDALALAWKILESREPVISVGQLGSVKAVDLSKIGEATKNARLGDDMKAVLANMPFTRAALEATNGKDNGVQLSDQVPSPTSMAAPAVAPIVVNHEDQQKRIEDLQRQVSKLSALLEQMGELVAA